MSTSHQSDLSLNSSTDCVLSSTQMVEVQTWHLRIGCVYGCGLVWWINVVWQDMLFARSMPCVAGHVVCM